MGHPLECDREGARSLWTEPEETRYPMGDLDPEEFTPEPGQAPFVSGVYHDGADSGNQIVSQGVSYSQGFRM
jgi:hypothetical protein